ncbi:MAG: PD-(D/E)XK nuclease family protein [Blastocatellia bacterium]|nr:PD-(D/E)XK nuclease family protein [Blastocatellia bacterium]
MNPLDEFIFSQSALQDYVDCPRRFELRYLREVKWPALETQSVIEFEEAMQRGQEFHHLLHQHALGVPAKVIEATIRDAEMRLWWDAYVVWQAERLPVERHPEITMTAAIGGRLLMAKYDLIARTAEGEILIVDWKTGRSKRPGALASRMQTLVYPFVLARAGDWLNDGAPIPPDRIRMIYWFAEDARAVEFTINAEKLAADELRLTKMLDELFAWTTDNQQPTTSNQQPATDNRQPFAFPMTEVERRCGFCVYRSLCNRGEAASGLEALEEEEELPAPVTLDLDALEEIAF